MADAQTSTPSPEILQHLIDQAAHLSVLSVPSKPDSAAIRNGNAIIGMRVHERLHRLQIDTVAPTEAHPLRSTQRVGESLGDFQHLWMFMPDDFVATPGIVPPPTPLDPSRSQRFVMLDARCTLNTGQRDQFTGFGTGITLPTTVNGQPQLLVNAVGTVTGGSGRFSGHDAGTYLHCGEISPQGEFHGHILLRSMDPQGTLRSDRSLPALRSVPDPEPHITYALLRGEAVPSDPVAPKMGPNGQPIGLIVEQGLRLLFLDTAVGAFGVRAQTRIGQRVGRIIAHVVFDPAAASGSNEDPIPFTTWDEFLFEDADGQALGRFTADSSEGRVFGLSLAGTRSIRFGGVGKVLQGDGAFAGMNGLMTDNSVVVFEPHVSASVYVLRLNDPEGRFRASVGGG